MPPSSAPYAGSPSSHRVEQIPFAANPIEYWRLHPYGEYLLKQGGRNFTAPLYANLTLTNRCNLRCSICYSQSDLDQTHTPRSEMPIETFRRIAATIFPLLMVVELNSAGEPLTYSHIEEVLESIAAHDCDLQLQTNGTLFTRRNVEMLAGRQGRVAMSIDAVGPLFEALRVNGDWSAVDRGARDLAARRDPDSLDMIVTATVTRSSLDGILDVVRWCDDVGLDMAHFQTYNPIGDGREQAVPAEAMERQAERVANWCVQNGARVRFAMSDRLYYAPPGLSGLPSRLPYSFYPLEPSHPLANPNFLCSAPICALDIGVDGDVGPCCAGQGVPLGWVDTLEGFADLWFGEEMMKIRRSLLRAAVGPLVHPSCADCIGRTAPALLGQRRSIDYTVANSSDEALVCDLDKVPLSRLRHSLAAGHPFRARIPPGLAPARYRLYEDERPLDPSEEGVPPFLVHGTDISFTTSDGSDPVKNGRRYALKRISV